MLTRHSHSVAGHGRRILPAHATTHNVIVVDSDYAKAPEYPFPIPYQDAEDVVRWILNQSFTDPDKLTASGFSAGGAIALVMAGASGILPKGSIKHVIGFYNQVNRRQDAIFDLSRVKIPNGYPGTSLSPGLLSELWHPMNKVTLLAEDPSPLRPIQLRSLVPFALSLRSSRISILSASRRLSPRHANQRPV